MKQTLALKLLFGLALTLGVLPVSAQAQQSVAAQSSVAAAGVRTCLTCHGSDPKMQAILHSPMAVMGDPRTPFAQGGCAGCHGVSADHAAGKAPYPDIVFRGPHASPLKDRNEICLSCHQAGLRMNWQGSQHANNDIACTNCHTVHVQKDPVLVKLTQPEKCFTCHSAQRAQSFEFSHHPIREGKVVCSDCHNPHGSPGPKLLKEFTLNEVCYTCHAEKRGPLLWEHQPVRESCLNCHTPHGSTQARLLIQRPPFLCQNCHETGNHNAAPWTANQVPGVPSQYNNSALTGPSGSHFQILMRGCLNCHSQVHGSNSPAGAFLTR